MNLRDLTPEQIEKCKSCESAEELFKLASSEGIELTMKELESITGGSHYVWDSTPSQCPNCGGGNITLDDGLWQCLSCGHLWS